MKLNIGRKEIELQKITQLCGTNFVEKNYIVDSLYMYFSGHKYTENEEKYIDSIKMDNQEIGRKYFDIIRIKNINDLISELKISKTSTIMQWISVQSEDMQYQYELEELTNVLEVIYDNLNNLLLSRKIGIKITFEPKNLFEILQKSIVLSENDEILETKKGYDLLNTYLKLVYELQKINSQKRIIIIEDIDHIITLEQYEYIFSCLRKIVSDSNILFIITTSIDGFVYLDKEFIKGINVINNEFFSFPDYEYINKFLIENYPCQYIPTEDEILEKLKWIIQKIGNNDQKLDVRSEIYLKLINKTLGIDCCSHKQKINQLEAAFLYK